jgi:uncharacterized protein (DUF362 family)
VPTAPNNPNPRVAVRHGGDPYRNAREALEALPAPGVAGRFVLVKPNAGRAVAAGTGVVTDPRVTAAVLDYYLELNPARLAVGESPIVGVEPLDALEKSGIAEEARRRGVELIDMDAAPPTVVDLPPGSIIEKLNVCAAAQEADHIVSIPVVKMHMHVQVSLGIKNMKGALWRKQKVKLHQLPASLSSADERGNPEIKPLEIAIADMATVLRPHRTVIDGTVAQEGLGPSAGSPRTMELAIAGDDPVATDAVGAALMGLDPAGIHHLRLAFERGVGEIDLGRIDVDPANWRDWTVALDPPPRSIGMTFRDVTVHECEACSACTSTVMLFLKRYEDELSDYRLTDGRFHIALGKRVADAPEGTVYVGNCTAVHRGQGIWVKGCPPVASAILEAVKRGKGD